MAGAGLSAVERTTATAASGVLQRLLAGGHVLCDGAMGTMLHDRGISIDRCCDELNLSQPETVAGVHAEYLRAGADMCSATVRWERCSTIAASPSIVEHRSHRTVAEH